MESAPMDAESFDGGFFAVRGRSGDPTTEDLHARTAQPKRLNSGKSYGRATGAAAGVAPAAAALAETETHAVVRAGGVPAVVAAAAAAAAAEAPGGGLCSGRVLSHGWAFLCADGAVLAWEQGMVTAERTGAAISADQACLRFEHPSMVRELAEMEQQSLEVPLEAADLVSISPPWESSGGKREVMLASPGGLARYWPDIHSPRRYTDVDARAVAPGQSVTRVIALGPADFLCGLSEGGILRIRPGLARPYLLAQATSVLGLGFSTIKRMGSYLGHKTLGAATAPAAEPSLGAASTAATAAAAPVVALAVARPPRGCPASIPARVIRLTTEGLEVWSVAKGDGNGGGGTESLDVRQPLVDQVQRALGVRKACLLDVAVIGAPTNVSPPEGGGGDGSPVVNWGLELLVLAVAVGGGGGEDGEALSIHAVRVSSEEASWVGSSVSVKLLSSHPVSHLPNDNDNNNNNNNNNGGASAAGQQASAPSPSSRLRATLVADNERAFCQRGGNNTTAFSFSGGGGGTGGGGAGVTAHVFWASSPPTSSSSSSSPGMISAAGAGAGTREGAAQVWSVCVKVGAGAAGAEEAEDRVEWEGRGSVEVSGRAALVGGCIGGGGALLGCPGVVLLSERGQAVWVAPRNVGSSAAEAGGEGGRRSLMVDLGPSPETMLTPPAMSSGAAAEEWRLALIDEGLNAFETGQAMDSAKLAVESLLIGQGVVGSVAEASQDLDAAIVQAGLEVLNGSWRHPSAFTSPHQLVHLALREKARRHRALLRFLLDAGAWGGAQAGRAALAEGGEKIAAASRLCELQDAISRKSVGAKAARLLDECITLSLKRRQEEGGGGASTPVAAGDEVKSERDLYFEHTEGVLDALVELHTPRLDDAAPSSSVDGATLTPLSRGLRDPSLAPGDRLQVLDHLSVVVAGVLEAALRHRASERSVYRAGARGRVWTASGEARRVLYRQLLAYTIEIEAASVDVNPHQGAASGWNAGGISSSNSISSSESSRGVIGRLAVLLLDGFKEEEEVDPAAAGKVEWQGEYLEAKALCVTVVAACGREDLARSLAAKHGYLEGTVTLCHQAEMRKPGCQNGHNLLRQRMAPPPQGLGRDGPGNNHALGAESEAARLERESFARFVLDWHLRRGLKTALLDVGAAVPNILCEFLADWREAELLWMFQIRLQDYTGAGRALTRGTPPPNQKGGKCEAQHLWLSLAKLAFLAGGGGAGGGGGLGGDEDLARGAEIQRRLDLAEVRDRLVKFLPAEEVAANAHLMNQPWTWIDALEVATRLLNSFSQEGMFSDEGEVEEATGYDVEEAADIAFQGYRALVAGLSEGSPERAYDLWREVVGLILADKGVREAVAKGALPSASGDRTAATDRQMEAVWKRPTVLHLLLRAIKKDRRLHREAPWAATAAAGEESQIDLTDESLFSMVHELLPAAADGDGATCEAWIAAIRKCPW